MRAKKLGILLLMVCFIFSSTGIQVYAAEIGEILLEPESGWKRYDDTVPQIFYGGGGWSVGSYSGNYKSTVHLVLTTSKPYYVFKFYGSKFRIITDFNYNHAENIQVTIDDNLPVSYSEYAESVSRSVLGFEKVDLDYGYHTVKVEKQNTDGNAYFTLDAIDIDEDGELLHPYTPTNLKAAAGDEEVGLSWDEVEGADSYIIKRSETEGGSYAIIEEDITGTSYTDRTVDNGTTYYYVVSAVIDGDESDDSNEASATPEGSSSGSGDKALLRITMQNGKINEYDLSMDEVEDFIDWFEDGDDPYYIIEKDYNIGPFESRKDYIVADKILQFEVMEYED
ncbi:fibronectin type III domain-containing protein [Wukongibacter baidiensis]|uniref:hypothetical protein n=1 Tax=Wukongibacter baidiensis TaxID=1723361 RepID=UPI003D7FB36F